MYEVIGIRFKKAGKVYFLDPNGIPFAEGESAVVETARGVELGHVVKKNHMVDEKQVVQPLKKVLRKATAEDLAQQEEDRKREKEAFQICEEKIAKHKLGMKLVDAEITFDHNKMIFYFTADGRVDFRELVKELAAVFRTRIELRQIGVRDEAKMLGGIGICGRKLCCASFLEDFTPVSIRMAKEQNLSLNPTKISGICGRLMCCLKYEEEMYEELNKKLHFVGDIIETPDGTGEILAINVLLQAVKAAVRKKENDPPTIGFYHVDEIQVIRSKKSRKNHLKPEAKHVDPEEILDLDLDEANGPSEADKGREKNKGPKEIQEKYSRENKQARPEREYRGEKKQEREVRQYRQPKSARQTQTGQTKEKNQ